MAIWRRFWVQKWPKVAQNSLKSPQTTPKMVRNDVETFLKKSILGSFWGHFGVILGSFWVILGHFGVILGSFWGILGSLWVFWVFWVMLSPKKPKPCSKKPKLTPKMTSMAQKKAPYTPLWVPKNRLKHVFRGQNNGRKRIFRPWSPYKCC